MGLCVLSCPISLVMIERICILCLNIIIESEVWTITHCLGLGHETMVCAVCISVFLTNMDFDQVSRKFYSKSKFHLVDQKNRNVKPKMSKIFFLNLLLPFPEANGLNTTWFSNLFGGVFRLSFPHTLYAICVQWAARGSSVVSPLYCWNDVNVVKLSWVVRCFCYGLFDNTHRTK